jgi:glycosyltransferase involved in cell wall biosynthesis
MREALLVTPVPPDAFGDGRAKRAHQWLTHLAGSHRVTVVVIAETASACAEADTFLHRAPCPPRWRRLTRLLGLLPLVGDWVRPPGWVALTPALGAWLDRALAGRSFDRIVCFRLYLAEVAAHVANAQGPAATTLDLDDLEFETRQSILRRLWIDGHRLRAVLEGAGLGAWRAQEVRWGRRFGRVTVCCEEDRATVRSRLPMQDVAVMPNRLWRGALPETSGDGAEPRFVLFVGALGYAPNVSAALFFAREVMPRLLAEHPQWRFAVVGRGGSAALRRQLAECAGTIDVGPVDAVAPWYARCAMVVAPLQAGGGTKLKVLEALCLGRPLVATREAVRGLGLRDGEHYLAAETAEAFATACRRLAADAELGQALTRQGQALALAGFTYAEADGR